VSSEEKQLLFGEYAAGRISAADKRRLMAAALEDQELFDAIAEQEELSELTVSLPAAPAKRKVWPFLMTAAATGAVALGLFLMMRPQPEPVVEMAKAVPPPVEVAGPPPEPLVSAPAPVRKQAPMPMASPKVAAEEPEAKKAEAAEVATFAAPPPYQVLRREPEGPPQMVDGEALLVRYRAEQAGRFALVDTVSGQELAAATAAAGQPVDLPFTAVRGAMNLEIRRVEVALGAARMADRAESRAAAPAAPVVPSAGGAAPRQAPSAVRISLTIR
jgi:hypothetical protein